MRILIPGGTGQVGTLLARTFQAAGHEVVVLSRSVARGTPAPWRVREWNSSEQGEWTEELEGTDVVINLVGRSVNCRYSARNRAEILESRVQSVRALGAAISKAGRPPAVWLQASTATIYAHRFDAPNDEDSGILGGREANVPDTWNFSIDVAMAWERALDEAPTPQTRKVKLRSAMIMGPEPDGIFDTLLTLVCRGLGGTAGDGRQFVSWIHEADFARAIFWLIEHESVTGAVNLAAPNPLPNREFMAALRRAWGAAIGLPAARWMLEIGAVFLRTETELILKSRRVVPGLLLAKGFSFQYPDWRQAAQELCREWRSRHA
jgi:uncharacterized protein